MPNHSSNRVVIVGGGVAGLSAAVRLAQAGLPVTVLEASQLGVGASTRNQGWLHSGGWFAPTQIELARLCHESLEQTLRFCPECVESDPEPMVYLASRNQSDLDRWTTAWDTAKIAYKELSDEHVAERFPDLALSQVHRAFELPDRSMRTDILLSRLADAAEAAGAEIRAATPVSRLIEGDGGVRGVEIDSGERLSARLVVLAGNAKGGSLFPGFGAGAVGETSNMALVVLKTHLIAARPQLSRSPLCVIDAEGLNHLPHRPMSVFGTSRWLPARHGEDEDVQVSEVDRIWEHVERLFPDFRRHDHHVTAWAGAAVHAMPVDQIENTPAPMPVVVDHAAEAEPVENLVSVFPGRASLWPHLAEKTSQRVLAKLQREASQIATPPWGVTATAASTSSAGTR